jgi:riboflavin transporter FmnP
MRLTGRRLCRRSALVLASILHRRAGMRSFVIACIAAVVIAAVGAAALNYFQEPAAVAFSTESVRL